MGIRKTTTISLLAATAFTGFVTLLPINGVWAASAVGLQIIEPIQPLPKPNGLDQAKVALGQKLFHDPILSGDGTISCATCHNLSTGGADHQPHSTGIGGTQGAIRAPTVYNSSLNFVQFWDGRAATLEEQASGPITNPAEMGASWPEVLKKLTADRTYAVEFKSIFGHAPTIQDVTSALASFEKTLITVNSRFDSYLLGDETALNETEREGYQLFKSYGCTSCHQGANVGGNMFEKFGFIGDYFTDRGHETKADLGRFNVTGQETDRHVFKVPSLRLAALGGPYFHDGSAPTLEKAVSIMARYQLGRDIPDKDRDKIVRFLQTLVGDVPNGVSLGQAAAPASSGRSPAVKPSAGKSPSVPSKDAL